jgi:hypothetical protein
MKKDNPAIEGEAEIVAVPVLASYAFSDGIRQMTLAIEKAYGTDRMQSILSLLYGVGLTLAAHSLEVTTENTIGERLPSLLKGYQDGMKAKADLAPGGGLH